MNRDQARHLSRTISHALRHAPHLYELELDEEGWTPVDALIQGLRHHRRAWQGIDLALIEAIVSEDSKGRYELEQGRIRALYGHSLSARLIKRATRPPALLFHGTSPAVAPLILEQGLKPMNRQYVHHALEQATALEVGRRKDQAPVLLQVEAQRAHLSGVTFYEGNALIWLSDEVPAEFIKLDPLKV